MYSLLSKIQSPEDLKKMSLRQLSELADEIRHFIVNNVSQTGGHLASNLGVVELSIALHYVFSSPKDKIIWDVGHQCYTHKLLTGRRSRFTTLRQKGGISGFPRRQESIHDIVDSGHSSTSISSALGILTGQELSGIKDKVIAVIGDGALTGGLAYEGLNNCGAQKKGLIIILNENKMSIDRNVGAMSSYLSRVTTTNIYQNFRNRVDKGVLAIPFIGSPLYKIITRLKRTIKALFFKKTMFSELGYEYVGPLNGHNLPLLIQVLKNVKKLDSPIVIHLRTKKGLGYSYSENNPEKYHGVGPFDIDQGSQNSKGKPKTFTSVFAEKIVDLAEENTGIVAVTAAMMAGTGLSEFQKSYPDRFFDVGIAEQHAVTFAAGLALSGKLPVVAIYSTFMQRAVDQFIHDVAIPGLPLIIAMDRAGLVGGDGETHQGIFDVVLFRSIPGITFMAPSSAQEMSLMLDFAVKQKHPVLIRYSKYSCFKETPSLSVPLKSGQGVFARFRENSSLLIIAMGTLLQEAYDAGEMLFEEGILADVCNLRFISPIDEDYWSSLLASYKEVLFVEDGIVSGGMGEFFSSFIQKNKIQVQYKNIGVPMGFPLQALRSELVASCGMDAQSIRTIAVEELKGLKKSQKEIL